MKISPESMQISRCSGADGAHCDPAITSDGRLLASPTAQGPLTSRQIATRLFLTCWLVYTLHFATNIVREIYPALALGDHLSFRLDEYAHMHPDLFETPGRGWHSGNNPGGSMVAAIPYAVFRPLIDRVVEKVRASRVASGQTEPPAYHSTWPMARQFYVESWRRGFDIKFGLAAFVMQAFCMAPVSALGVLAMFHVLRPAFRSERAALWLALLYAFGTPVFFRAGYLNHNMMLGHFAFMGFVAMWNPGGDCRLSSRWRFYLGGLAGGTTVLFDYSGVVILLAMFVYGLANRLRVAGLQDAARHGCVYALGTLAPIGLLWFYQWQSFGHPFYPGQHWMPPVEWIEQGYQGYSYPQFTLLLSLALDYRFGLFVTSPLLLLAMASPFLNRRSPHALPSLELAFALCLFAAFWIFFSGSNYTRLQFNTGMRYLAPMLPFLFLPAAVVVMRLPFKAILLIGVLSITQSWALAMYRDVERGMGVLDPVVRTFLGGFSLPALTTLSNMEAYRNYFPQGASPLPLFALAAAVLFVIWMPRVRQQPETPRPAGS